MVQDQRFPTSFSRRRFLQYGSSMALGGSFLAACAGTSSGGGGSSSNSSVPSLTQWYHQYGEAGTHEAVLKYAKEYTKANVTVNWDSGSWADQNPVAGAKFCHRNLYGRCPILHNPCRPRQQRTDN